MKQEKTESIINPYINSLLGKESSSVAMWNNFPTYIDEVFRAGIITGRERLVYISLRSQCNPYGYCVTSIDSIIDEVFANKCERPYVNKILSQLRGLRLVWYKDRKGVSGKFEVYFDDFICPYGKISDLQNKFGCRYKESKISSPNLSEMQVTVDDETDKCTLKHNVLISVDNKNSNQEVNEIAGSHIHIDTHKQNQINTVSNIKENDKYICKNPTENYQPNYTESYIAFNIAQTVGETCMDRYLQLMDRGHFAVLEKAYGELKEDIEKGKRIINKASYLNTIVIRLLREKAVKSV